MSKVTIPANPSKYPVVSQQGTFYTHYTHIYTHFNMNIHYEYTTIQCKIVYYCEI